MVYEIVFSHINTDIKYHAITHIIPHYLIEIQPAATYHHQWWGFELGNRPKMTTHFKLNHDDIQTHIYTYTYTYTYAYAYTYTYSYSYTYTYIYTYTCIYIYIHVYVLYTHTHTHIQVYVYIYNRLHDFAQMVFVLSNMTNFRCPPFSRPWATEPGALFASSAARAVAILFRPCAEGVARQRWRRWFHYCGIYHHTGIWGFP